MNKNKPKVLIESDGVRDWLAHIAKSKKKREYRLTEAVNLDGKKKLSYDVKSYREEEPEMNINVLKFPYKFSKLKIKNYDELTDSLCSQIAEPKEIMVKRRGRKKKIDNDNDNDNDIDDCIIYNINDSINDNIDAI